VRRRRRQTLQDRLRPYTIGTDAQPIADWLETLHPVTLPRRGVGPDHPGRVGTTAAPRYDPRLDYPERYTDGPI
jgi:hypothetical protein